MCKKELVLISPLYRIDKRTRISKLVDSCNALGVSVCLVCWDRLDEYPLPCVDDRVEEVEVLMRGGGYGGKRMKFLYLIWMFKLAVYLIKKQRHSTIYSLGFENAFPVYATKKLLNNKYVFDDADRFSMLFTLPKIALKVLQFFERKTSEGSVVNIIPGVARYEFRNNKQRIIRNNPDQRAMARAAEMHVEKIPDELVVYLNGWLGETRGLPTALAVAQELLDSPDEYSQKIRFVAAGRLDGPSSEAFVKLSNVQYLGEVSNDVALSYYKIADFVFTYYDPAIRINQYAESNKWGDAIANEVPILVNNEVKTSDFLVEADCCATFKYSDSMSVVSFLCQASRDPGIVSALRKNIKTVKSQGRAFDVDIEETLLEVLS